MVFSDPSNDLVHKTLQNAKKKTDQLVAIHLTRIHKTEKIRFTVGEGEPQREP